MSFDPHLSPLKAMTWERAKGELRACVAVHGATQSPDRHNGQPMPFEALRDKVEAFILDVEESGLSE